VGVAGVVKLGFWLKMERNYPCLLNRTVAEKSQYAPAPEAYMALAAKYLPVTLCVTLLDCRGTSAVVKVVVRCCFRLA
jgi:hypothetical protein